MAGLVAMTAGGEDEAHMGIEGARRRVLLEDLQGHLALEPDRVLDQRAALAGPLPRRSSSMKGCAFLDAADHSATTRSLSAVS